MFFRDAWDMAAENCLSKLPQLLSEPNAEFQVTLLFKTIKTQIRVNILYFNKFLPEIVVLLPAKPFFHGAIDGF